VKIGPADPEIFRLPANKSATTQNWLPWQRPLSNRKSGPDQENSRKYLPFGEKIMKIGPVDTELALLRVKKRKKKEINASKIYSPSGKFEEQVKKHNNSV